MDDLGNRIQRLILSLNEERQRLKGQKPVSATDQILRGIIIVSIAAIGILLVRYVISLSTTVRAVLQVCFFCFQLGLITWFVASFIRRRMPSIQIPKRLARGECPGCLYDLAGLPPERIETIERAVRCPECGAVWRAARIGRSVPRVGPP